MVERDAIEQQVVSFITALKRRHITGSYDTSLEMVRLLRSVISISRWTTAKDLMETILRIGSRITAAQPSELAMANMVRRVLFIIREEYSTEEETVANAKSLASIMSKTLQGLVMENEDDDYREPKGNLKSQVIEVVNELYEELESSRQNIASYATEMIHSNEIILTYGQSHTVEAFLKNAARKRTFNVIVAEGPDLRGHEMAKTLSEAGIETVVITDSAVFALMSRVNKVIVGTHGVMADGGLMSRSGLHNIALAAKHHSVPVIVCAALYKLTPRYPCSYDHNEFNDLASPDDALPYSEAGAIAHAEVRMPLYDYVPPNLISLYITNQGGYAPTYVYRLLSEYYHPDDHSLE
eukprot:comp22177_c0_seq1/m.32561 comp22177_c0_seq1/g.32561  ORF comp22177_c0_seq1/g.32561 comp22177_c0_seq1/m.32561 type:complete len:353 (-) comp22177_c0_seq1:174-1232(-)